MFIMKVSFLKINNFRCIKTSELYFEDHTLLVGRNNVGKSTICEALDLVLGPDRLGRSTPIDEYDFYNSEYLGTDGNLITIKIEVVLTDLSEKAESTFNRHLQFWHLEEKRVLGPGEIDTTDETLVVRCLVLFFEGKYDKEEDDFEAKTFYSHSPDEDEGVFTEVRKSQKREIGFLYLRAVRTGNRALSLERGTLLDILLRLGKIRPQLWEGARKQLMELDPPLEDSVGELRPILDNIEARINQYIPLDPKDKATNLFVSQLTREHLRKTLSFFLSTSKDQNPVPFQKLGTGTLNTLVFALLSAIADLKKDNVIFAMEEPEIAVSPHTQRRVVNYLLGSTSQSFITSHSPYVIERFTPEQIKILKKDNDAKVTSTTVALGTTLKAKTFKKRIRHSIAEAILGQAVIVGEGLCEYQVLVASAEIMELTDENNYPLDLSGVTIFDAEGDGYVKDYGAFFKSLGLKTFAFYDKLGRTPTQIIELEAAFDINKQTDYTGIETLLATEIPFDVQWLYLTDLSTAGVLTSEHITIPAIRPSDAEIKQLTINVLAKKKGESRVVELIKHCTVAQLPVSVTDFLSQVYTAYPKPETVGPIDFEEDNETEEVTTMVTRQLAE